MREVAADVFRISWPSRGAVKMPFMLGRELGIEVATPGGLGSFVTTVVAREATDLVLRRPAPDALSLNERRRHVRRRLVPPRAFELRPDPGMGFRETWAAQLIDLTIWGCQVHLSTPVFEGLQVELLWPGSAALAAETVYCVSEPDGPHTVGLRFAEPAEGLLAKLTLESVLSS